MLRFSIFGYYGEGNAGDEAILAALAQGLKKYINNVKICAYSANPTATAKDHGINSYYFFPITLSRLLRKFISRRSIAIIQSLINFIKTDVVIIGGGGLYCDLPETNKWLLFYLDLISISKRFGKKVIIMGVSVGPLHHADSKVAINKAFKDADIISVRDELSKEMLTECGVAADRILVIPDLVFSLESKPKETVEKILRHEEMLTGAKSVVLTPCYYNEKQSGWTEQYIKLCEEIASQTQLDIWMIPMQRSSNYDDLTAINNIYERLSTTAQTRTKRLKGFYNAQEIQGVIEQADYVIAERLHGSIMALNTNRPLRAIAYKPKVTGVLQFADLGDKLISMNDFLSGAAIDKFFSLFSETAHASQMENTKTAAVQNFKVIESIIPSQPNASAPLN